MGYSEVAVGGDVGEQGEEVLFLREDLREDIEVRVEVGVVGEPAESETAEDSTGASFVVLTSFSFMPLFSAILFPMEPTMLRSLCSMPLSM